MEFQELAKRAMKIRNKYADIEKSKIGREWTTQEIMMGFVGDIGDLTKLIMASGGIREIDDVNKKIEHELSDCLWCIFVLAEKLNINLEEKFLNSMNELENKIQQLNS